MIQRRPADDPDMTATSPIGLEGEALSLHADRAIFWPRRKTLLVADVHLGKEHAFSRQGVPIPAGPSEHSLKRLTRLVIDSLADRLIVLGDLMHATPHTNESWLPALSQFLDDHQTLEVIVCAGNHDKPAGQLRIDQRIRWQTDPLVEPPFVFQHHPGDSYRGYVMAGHIHPVYRLHRRRGGALRLPAFWFTSGHTVLPAFGSFTGGHVITPRAGDRIHVCGPKRVVEVALERAT